MRLLRPSQRITGQTGWNRERLCWGRGTNILHLLWITALIRKVTAQAPLQRGRVLANRHRLVLYTPGVLTPGVLTGGFLNQCSYKRAGTKLGERRGWQTVYSCFRRDWSLNYHISYFDIGMSEDHYCTQPNRLYSGLNMGPFSSENDL